MTEKPVEYRAGEVEDYYWVECRVRLPGDRDPKTGEFKDFACKAKVQVADLIDALDLDRWTTQAFQYIWRSGRKPGENTGKELAKAAWFLQRGVEIDNHWQSALCDVVAAVIERSLDRHGSQTVALGLSEFADSLRKRNLEAVQLVVDCYGDELTKAPRTGAPLKVKTMSQDTMVVDVDGSPTEVTVEELWKTLQTLGVAPAVRELINRESSLHSAQLAKVVSAAGFKRSPGIDGLCDTLKSRRAAGMSLATTAEGLLGEVTTLRGQLARLRAAAHDPDGLEALTKVVSEVVSPPPSLAISEVIVTDRIDRYRRLGGSMMAGIGGAS